MRVLIFDENKIVTNIIVADDVDFLNNVFGKCWADAELYPPVNIGEELPEPKPQPPQPDPMPTTEEAIATLALPSLGIEVEQSKLVQAQEVVLMASNVPVPDPAPTGEWKAGEWVNVGTERTYQAKVYIAIQSHCTQSDWTPDKVPALWQVKATSDEWEAGVAYKTGDKVTYQDVWYGCLQGHTSQKGWEPPNVPALWKAV